MFALCGMLGLLSSLASAQPVELPEGSVLGNARMRAMGGAFTGVAESGSAVHLNPAAMVIRHPSDDPRWAQAEVASLIQEHPFIRKIERRLFHRVIEIEPETQSLRSRWQTGVSARLGPVAATFGVRDHAWATDEGIHGLTTWSLGAGMAGETWAIGVLPELLSVRTEERTSTAPGGSIGGLWAPLASPVRLGARIRMPTHTRDVHVPAQVAAGVSVSTARNQPGRYGVERREGSSGTLLILSADVVWTEEADKALPLGTLSSTWNGPTAPSDSTLAVHAGSELRTLDQELRLRVGAYTIPGRQHAPTRLVGTAGAAWELLELPNGRGLRAAVAVETGLGGTSWTVGFEGG